MINPKDHLGLAHHVARRMWSAKPWKYLELADVLQEACVGLCIAANLYDPKQGTAFATYATAVMEGVIKRAYYYNRRIVRYGGPNVAMRAWKLRDVDLSQPLDASLAQAVTRYARPLTEIEVERCYGYAVGTDSSLDVVVTLEDGEAAFMVEALPDDTAQPTEDTVDTGFVQRVFNELPASPRSRSRIYTLLKDRILTDEPRPLEDIAKEWGCTRQRVHQIEADVLQVIRNVAKKLGVAV